MSATGALAGLAISVLALGIGACVFTLIVALLDGLRDGEWGPFVFMSVLLAATALGALIWAVVA